MRLLFLRRPLHVFTWVLIVCTCFLWWRSYTLTDGIVIPLGSEPELRISSNRGVVALIAASSWKSERLKWYSYANSAVQQHYDFAEASFGRSIDSHDYSFSFKRREVTMPGGNSLTLTSLTFPHWLLVSLLAMLPVSRFFVDRIRNWNRRRKGLCLACGYDLTGSTSTVCSECGAPVYADEFETRGADR